MADSVCAVCEQPTGPEKVSAAGNAYCVACFRCETCGMLLGGKPFCPKDGKIYCEQHYHEQFGQKCAECGETILGPHILALGSAYHEDHFVCYECKQPFEGSRFFKREDEDGVIRPYCEADYFRLFPTLCNSCEQPIVGEVFRALDKLWHQHCFVCAHCNCAFVDDDGNPVPFCEHEGKPYCEQHYNDLFVLKCATCSKGIFGEYVTAGESHYHKECFVCAVCETTLLGVSFGALGGTLLCDGCLKNGSLPATAAAPPAAAPPAATPPAPKPAPAEPAAPKPAPAEPAPAEPAAPEPAAPEPAAPEPAAPEPAPAPVEAPVAPAPVPVEAPVAPAPVDTPVAPTPTPVAPAAVVESAPAEEEVEDSKDSGPTGEVTSEGLPVYPYSQLKAPGPYPADVDVAARETYLSDAEFTQFMGMDRAAYDKLPKWKKHKTKKAAQLF